MNDHPENSNKFEKLREKAEQLLRTQPEPSSETSADMLELIHELRIHQAELEIQNEELKRAEQEISGLKREYENLYEFAPCGYLTLNSKGIITRINLTGARLLGTDRKLIYRQGFSRFIEPGWDDTFWSTRAKCSETCEKQSVELPLKTKKGPPVWVRAEIEADRDAAGAVIQWRVVLVDITEYLNAVAEKEKVQAKLHQSQKMESVGRLAGGVAHDFNNMLGIILGYTEMAQCSPGLSSSVHENLEEIRKAASRSADLVSQLLAFARKQTASPKVLDLNETVEGMLKMLRRLVGENIDLAWQPRADVYPVRMDPSQIDQIFANLCVNARDAIEDVGEIAIETGKATFDDAYCKDHVESVPGEYALLAVSDDGCGMSQETIKNLFEPFFTTKEIGKGTGLGLATVYGIVKQNNGFINVYSEPGKGTTFKIYLPRYEEKGKQVPENNENLKPVGGRETILLVEDEPTILKMTSIMLERLGYRVLGAHTPGEAIQL